jgi:hypothetical protein
MDSCVAGRSPEIASDGEGDPARRKRLGPAIVHEFRFKAVSRFRAWRYPDNQVVAERERAIETVVERGFASIIAGANRMGC